ncbi:hypothetical protein MAC_07551 [Metarhizium acridum CQMa 102]|uniref:DUF4396 domain-containing protein n=1 Tax=Metarhizium acridum (strain CQMa 102) TaxID=655827 RepID=E9ECF3_METAQ|nr:uncharacterized protein MAC_07551 [Metarhizium acridum CQMa 102]EFY86406.1 hypothetical protein MAC_07551 [Metarhizium acridum CQMa 102]
MACQNSGGKNYTNRNACGVTSKPNLGSPFTLALWLSKPAWRRASVNTLRCLVGCTAGDFSAMWYLQASQPDLGMGAIMAISMASGITTSLALETVLLRKGRDGMSWPVAVKTAAGMSMISMMTMELAENAVDYHLTGGQIAIDSPAFWVAGAVAMAAGFLAPLPYNYLRLKKYGKACH